MLQPGGGCNGSSSGLVRIPNRWRCFWELCFGAYSLHCLTFGPSLSPLPSCSVWGWHSRRDGATFGKKRKRAESLLHNQKNPTKTCLLRIKDCLPVTPGLRLSATIFRPEARQRKVVPSAPPFPSRARPTKLKIY